MKVLRLSKNEYQRHFAMKRNAASGSV